MSGTLSIWRSKPESARKMGHPAPFPMVLADRVERVYSYMDDVILDPFCGSGTTCLAAALSGRPFVGYTIVPNFCELTRERIAEALRFPSLPFPDVKD